MNGFAERFDIGVGTYRMTPGPCLACRYPMNDEAISEIVVMHAEVGLDPRRIRELLDTVAPLMEEDLTIVQQHLGLDEATRLAIVGKPLRSVREHLCAVGRVTAPTADAEVDVPLGFVSGLCGVAVVADLVRLSIGAPREPGGKANLKVPIPATAAWLQAALPDCFVCDDPDYVDTCAEKYGR